VKARPVASASPVATYLYVLPTKGNKGAQNFFCGQ